MILQSSRISSLELDNFHEQNTLKMEGSQVEQPSEKYTKEDIRTLSLLIIIMELLSSAAQSFWYPLILKAMATCSILPFFFFNNFF